MKKSIFLFFAAILCAMTANAYNQSAVDLYFDNSEAKWSSCYVYIGHSSWTSCYPLTRVSGTQYLWQLAKANFNGGSAWKNATGWVLCNEKWWDGNGESIDKFVHHGDNNVTQKRTSAWSASYIYKTNGTANTTGADSKTIKAYKTTTVSKKNYTVTINTVEGGTLTVKDYDNNAVATGASKIYLTVLKFSATPASGYVLDAVEINDGTNTTTIAAADLATKTHTLTSDVTITPIFVPEDTHEVTVSYLCNSNPIAGYDSKKEEVGVTTPSSFTAPKIKDYTFSGWTLGTGVTSEDKTANPISITTKSSGEYTLTANYTYIEPVIKTIYCKMEYNWWTQGDAAISAYASGTEGEMKSGLGTLMTLAPWESNVWKLDIDIARYQKVQFIRVSKDGKNDYNARTAVLDIPTDTKDLYTITQSTDMWYNGSYTCSGTWSTYTPATVPDRYLTGNAAGFGMTIDGEGNEQWSPNTIKMTWNNATQKFTHTVSGLEANKYYKFRITDGTWAGKWGYSNLNPTVANVFEAEDNNISFVLSAAGDLTIAFDGTNIELTPTSSFAAPVYTIVGDAAVTGCHWDVNSVENQMVQDATDENQFTLVKTVTAVAGEYEYKAIRNHSYDWEVASGTKLTIEKDGTGTITYTLDVSTKKLTAVVSDWVEGSVTQEVTLVGIGEDKDFTEAADHKTTSVAVELEANSVYTFEVVVNSVYMKNNGIMWRGNCTNWTFKSEENNAHIVTDLAGTYTFTWTYEGNKLSVKYPDGTNVPAPVFLAGKMNNWERLATRLIPSADGTTASATVELERNVYNDFRMVVGTEDWTNTGTMDRDNRSGWEFVKVTEANKDVNAGIVPDATGEYIFTWSYADNKLSVRYPEACKECSNWYLCGDFNSWGLGNEFTKVDDKTVTTTVTLEAGEYKFKVQDMTNPRDGKWWGNKGKMQRNSDGLTTGWTFEEKSGDDYNCIIVADIAGDYIFTWNTDTKKLSVKYPTLTITLIDGDNSTVIAAHVGSIVNVQLNRSFTANDGYYTLCLPFDIVASEIGTAYELGTVTKYQADGGININLTPVSDIVAGKPYLVLPKTLDNPVFKNVKIVDTEGSYYTVTGAGVKVTFTGIINGKGEKTNGETEYYVGDEGKLYNGKVDKLGLRAFFTITDKDGNPTPIRARVVAGENVETGVEDIITTDAPVKVIENGQLIIIRDGVKYNVQGVRL